jgi:membrane associated rhomboid family serine protease
MAFGFTPKHIEQISLDGLTPQQFLALCVKTAERMQWDIRYKSNAGLVTYTDKGLFRNRFKVTVLIEDGLATLKSESTGSEMYDMGRNKKTILAFADSMKSVKAVVTPAMLDAKYGELAPGLTPPEEDFLINPSLDKSKGSIWSLFVPRQGFFITPLTIDINIAVFLLMVMSGAGFMAPDNTSLIAWGANYTPLTLGGQWWRLITNTFVHVGIMHLLFNMYAFMYIGMLLEPLLGKLKFAIAYVLTGILASLASLWWHDIVVSAGASGAIFGMYGVFLAMLTTNFIEKSQRRPLLTSIGIFVFYNLAYGAKGNIDNAAHVGGLISGIVIGYLYYFALRKSASVQLSNRILAFVIVICLTASVVFYKKIPNDIAVYEQKMKSFSEHERAALDFFKLPFNATKEDSLTAIRVTGINNWREDIKIVNEVKRLHIPARLRDQADILMNYCNDRVASYELIYKAVDENSGLYNDSINYYNSQLEQILNNLKSPKSDP